MTVRYRGIGKPLAMWPEARWWPYEGYILQEHWENTCWQPHATPSQTLGGEEGWQPYLGSIH